MTLQEPSVKRIIVAFVLAVSLVAVPVWSQKDLCEELLEQVDSYPRDRIWELVQKAPVKCKMQVKKAIFERRRVIVDDFGDYLRHYLSKPAE